MTRLMFAITLAAALTSGCLQRLQLGGGEDGVPAGSGAEQQTTSGDTSGPAKTKPIPAEGTFLRVTDLGVSAARMTPSMFARTATGDVIVATDGALITVFGGSAMSEAYHVNGGGFKTVRGAAYLADMLFLATDAGPFVCTRDETRLVCERTGEHGGVSPEVIGFAPMPAGRVLYATPEDVGVMKASSPYFSPPTKFTAPAPVSGTTRVWSWLLHAKAPYACRLTRMPTGLAQTADCTAADDFTAPVRQAAESGATMAFATWGDGVIVQTDSGRTKWQTPDARVSDLVVWQGDLWAGTEAGLAQYDLKTGESRTPDPEGLGDLAGEPVAALALGDDGGLIAAIGRSPVRLYLLGTR